MKVDVACYAVIGSKLQEGIPAVWQNNGQEERPLAQLGHHADDDAAIRRAQICWANNALPSKQGVLVAVYPPRLKLSGQPLARNLNFWPGGENLHRDAVRSKNCRGIHRKKWPNNRFELFLLFHGENMVVCDSAMRVGLITVSGNSARLIEPTPQAMVDYITKAGLRSGTHRSLTWAIRNIEAIWEEQARIRTSDQLRALKSARARVKSLAYT